MALVGVDDVIAVYRQTHSSIQLAWPESRQLLGTDLALIK